MQNLFIKYNIIDDDYITDQDEFMLVQTFIYKLGEEKYKKDIVHKVGSGKIYEIPSDVKINYLKYLYQLEG